MTIEGPRNSCTILLEAGEPPAFPIAAVVDVRPGPGGSFDGDRFRLPLLVRSRADGRTVPATTPAELEAAVGRSLPTDGVRLVRFGDRRVVRRLLPAVRADALERRLLHLADETAATLLTWTTGCRRPGDGRRYDVVVEPTTWRSGGRPGGVTGSGPPGARPGHR